MPGSEKEGAVHKRKLNFTSYIYIVAWKRKEQQKKRATELHQLYTYVYVYVCMYVFLYVCMYVCIYRYNPV